MTNKRTKENVLKEFFDSIRDENEGKITKAKLQAVAKELGYEFSDEEIKDMIEVADPKGEGAVTYKGLAKMVHESDQDFPRLKTSIAEIRRELTTLSIAQAKDETEEQPTAGQSTNGNSTESDSLNEPTPSTSKGESVVTLTEPGAEKEEQTDRSDKNKQNDKIIENGNDSPGELEADNGVIIGKVMKARENDNRKIHASARGKGPKPKLRPTLVVPVSESIEDDRNTIMEEEDSDTNGKVGGSKVSLTECKSPQGDAVPAVVLSPETEKAETSKRRHSTHSKHPHKQPVNDNDNETANKHLNNRQEEEEEEGIDEDPFESPENVEDLYVADNNREVQSRQSAATRFSLDAGVVTAVDKYHGNRKDRHRALKRVNKQTENQELREEDELQELPETESVEERSKTSLDNRAYIRDKTKRVRRKASLTGSQEDTRKTVNKPVVRKRSQSKGRVHKAKGPIMPSDKHAMFYSGLGCALKISQLRTKQRLLYQMWQLVYDEAMMRVQQTFHYDYAKDPAPVSKEKLKPIKKPKKRNSTSKYD